MASDLLPRIEALLLGPTHDEISGTRLDRRCLDCGAWERDGKVEHSAGCILTATRAHIDGEAARTAEAVREALEEAKAKADTTPEAHHECGHHSEYFDGRAHAADAIQALIDKRMQP